MTTTAQTSTQSPSTQSPPPRGGGFQPPVTCYNPADLECPAQTTLFEIMRDCDHMLTDLQLRLLAIACDQVDGDGVACLPVRRIAESVGVIYKNILMSGGSPPWSPPSGLEVANEFAAIAELGLIAIATVGGPNHFLVLIGSPHCQSAVVRAAAEFINSTFGERPAA